MTIETVTQAASIPVRLANVDALSLKLQHLQASLFLIFGEGLENFRDQSPQMQDAYLWGCAEITQDCLNLLNAK